MFVPTLKRLRADWKQAMQDFRETRCDGSKMELVTRGTDLTIVVPTLNERDNLEPLLALVSAVLGCFVGGDLR